MLHLEFPFVAAMPCAISFLLSCFGIQVFILCALHIDASLISTAYHGVCIRTFLYYICVFCINSVLFLYSILGEKILLHSSACDVMMLYFISSFLLIRLCPLQLSHFFTEINVMNLCMI